MKLGEIYEKPLKEVLKNFDLVKENIHTNDKGEIQSIELKYIPKDASTESVKLSPVFGTSGKRK